MKHSKFNDLSHFEINQFGLNPFMGIASPADVRPNLYGVD